MNQLQLRTKWRKPLEEPAINEVILIKDENLPPLKWALGRIINIHPGSDGHSRVVTLKTGDNTIKRPITKISKLPISYDEEEKKVIQSNMATRRASSGFKTNVMSIIWAMFTLFTVKSAALPVQNDPISLAPFIHKPGIYFEEQAFVYISNTNWNVITYYDLRNFFAELESVENGIQQFNVLCDTRFSTVTRSPQNDSLVKLCYNIVDQLNDHLNAVKEKNVFFGHDVHNKQKRGALDIIGNVATYLACWTQDLRENMLTTSIN